VRILDLTTVVMGPWATHILADYGADVVKVEPPEGDITRRIRPARHADMGPLFLHANRGKRSVVLDLKQPASRAALLRLCRTADVFIHNIRRAALRRLRLEYADVSAANPRLVYVGLVGYGQTGPYAARPAYDDLVQAEAGLAALFPLAGDDAPRYVPALIADHIGGLSAAHAVLAGLLYRDRTGQGQAIEVPMFETVAELVLSDHLGGETFQPAAGPVGYGRLLTPERRPYRTRDGFVSILLYTERHWRRFFEVLGRRAQFDADPRLSDGALRRQHYHHAYRVVAEIVATRTTADWLDLLRRHDLPVAPINDVAGLLADEHLRATGFVEVEQHPSEGAVRSLGIPSRWSVSAPRRPAPAPRLGEHTLEVLREAGLDAAALAAVRAEAAAGAEAAAHAPAPE
jgi:crotonobetainyl-CoA:carnitine CoA-transferase CaiB-like acyl-CoA transferase